MKGRLRVVSPPPRPLMVYDGDCQFCRRWIRRWQRLTGEAVEYRPSQDAALAAQFPEIPNAQFVQAVQLIETDGAVYAGAEAVFRALAFNPRWRWPWRWYEQSPMFARAAERAYRMVARHRPLFSKLTR